MAEVAGMAELAGVVTQWQMTPGTAELVLRCGPKVLYELSHPCTPGRWGGIEHGRQVVVAVEPGMAVGRWQLLEGGEPVAEGTVAV